MHHIAVGVGLRRRKLDGCDSNRLVYVGRRRIVCDAHRLVERGRKFDLVGLGGIEDNEVAITVYEPADRAVIVAHAIDDFVTRHEAVARTKVDVVVVGSGERIGPAADDVRRRAVERGRRWRAVGHGLAVDEAMWSCDRDGIGRSVDPGAGKGLGGEQGRGRELDGARVDDVNDVGGAFREATNTKCSGVVDHPVPGLQVVRAGEANRVALKIHRIRKQVIRIGGARVQDGVGVKSRAELQRVVGHIDNAVLAAVCNVAKSGRAGLVGHRVTGEQAVGSAEIDRIGAGVDGSRGKAAVGRRCGIRAVQRADGERVARLDYRCRGHPGVDVRRRACFRVEGGDGYRAPAAAARGSIRVRGGERLHGDIAGGAGMAPHRRFDVRRCFRVHFGRADVDRAARSRARACGGDIRALRRHDDVLRARDVAEQFRPGSPAGSRLRSAACDADETPAGGARARLGEVARACVHGHAAGRVERGIRPDLGDDLRLRLGGELARRDRDAGAGGHVGRDVGAFTGKELAIGKVVRRAQHDVTASAGDLGPAAHCRLGGRVDLRARRGVAHGQETRDRDCARHRVGFGEDLRIQRDVAADRDLS